MAETKITKNLCMIFIDTSEGSGGPTWTRVDKSTILNIVMNAETESMDYISQELATEEIKSYKPSMDQEIATYKGNPIYEFMFQKFYNCDLAHGKTLICFPETEKGKQAWEIDDTTFTLNEMNYVDGKITWGMNFGGDIKRGTYTVSGGTPTFSASPAA